MLCEEMTLESLDVECCHARIYGTVAQFFFDAEQLVVLCHTFRTAGSTSLDLAGIQCNCQISNGRICGFAGTVRRNCSVACIVSHLDRFQCFGNRTDLVQLDQNGVAAAQFDALLQTFSIGNEQVVANQLYLAAQLCRQLLPAFPVFFVQSVFDRDDRILLYQFLPVFDQFF